MYILNRLNGYVSQVKTAMEQQDSIVLKQEVKDAGEKRTGRPRDVESFSIKINFPPPFVF